MKPEIIKKECTKQKRNAGLISIPFLVLAIWCFLILRGDVQILFSLFFMMIFFMFFGMFTAYDGVLGKLKQNQNRRY